MIRREFVRRIVDILHESNIRKPVSSPKQVFHISDDNGNQKDFVVKQTEKTVMYTYRDVDQMLDAFVQAAIEALKAGDTVNIRGFGTFGLRYRQQRTTKIPGTDQWVDIEARYIPKFTFGNELRMAAKAYELLRDEQGVDEPLPIFDDEGEDE